MSLILILYSCHHTPDKVPEQKHATITAERADKDTVIVDCHYTYQQAVSGTNAPKAITDQLELFDVQYYSVDNKIHKGQILSNKAIAGELKAIFAYMLKNKFVVEHAIPVVKYWWQDDLSMQDNNTYSFCYRNQQFSKHATGMAIDINPFFNPVRWKEGYEYRHDRPEEAHRDSSVNGTFYASHPVVQEFKRLGFFWGHNFKMKYDDHHFEK